MAATGFRPVTDVRYSKKRVFLPQGYDVGQREDDGRERAEDYTRGIPNDFGSFGMAWGLVRRPREVPKVTATGDGGGKG